MCGIAGYANFDADPRSDDPSLPLMIQQLRHRGPDGFGYNYAPGVGLAHARLSIIDLASGQQPLSNEDGQIWVTFNGEIFNYVELRSELIAAGHQFRTKSDTEVLVHAYEEWGLDFVHRLNGQFAFALHDRGARRVLIVRDRVGILPCFYTVQASRIVFASEIKAILPVVGRPSHLDPLALDQTLTFWSPVGPQTFFPGILQVQPGEMILLENGAIRRVRYWDWQYPPEGGHDGTNPDLLAEQLRALLIDATRLRLRSDVPVGAYLSGGLDSSILTTIIRRHTDTPLRTFSIGFEQASLDERSFQRELVDHLEAENSAMLCRDEDVAGAFLGAIRHAETVVVRTAIVPMMLLSHLVHQNGFRVVLTGEGADEVFGGYDLFKETKIRQFWSRQPKSAMRPALLQRLYPYLAVSPAKTRAFAEAFFGAGLDNPTHATFSHAPRWTTTSRCKEFFSQELRAQLNDAAGEQFEQTLPSRFQQWHWFNRAQYIENRTLLPGYLLSSQGDRMLMANSVEGRFPFLDHRVIAFASGLPPTLLMRGLQEKFLLKKAMGFELPESIVKRPKQPYRAPGTTVYFRNGRWHGEVRDLLAASTIRKYGYFDATRVGHLVAKVEGGRAIGEKDAMALTAIVSTQALHRGYIETSSPTEGVRDRDADATTNQAIHSEQLPLY
jgi:asparagine synthase (glutamine-hydrolysing)